MPLSKADTSKVQRFEDGAAWIELRTRLTKRDEDIINDLNSHYRMPPELFGIAGGESEPSVEVRANIAQTNRTLFELLVVAWSESDEKPTGADYDALDVESGRWVDKCVQEARKIGSKRAEGKAISNGKPRRSRGSSRSVVKST